MPSILKTSIKCPASCGSLTSFSFTRQRQLCFQRVCEIRLSLSCLIIMGVVSHRRQCLTSSEGKGLYKGEGRWGHSSNLPAVYVFLRSYALFKKKVERIFIYSANFNRTPTMYQVLFTQRLINHGPCPQGDWLMNKSLLWWVNRCQKVQWWHKGGRDASESWCSLYGVSSVRRWALATDQITKGRTGHAKEV